jgi:hypothetical protein
VRVLEAIKRDDHAAIYESLTPTWQGRTGELVIGVEPFGAANAMISAIGPVDFNIEAQIGEGTS